MKRSRSTVLWLSLVLIFVASGLAQTEVPKEIKGGILNGKAVSLPKPAYSEEAKAAGLEGVIRVNVLVDELGNVISAEVLGNKVGKVTLSPDGKTETIEMEAPHPLLGDAARQAAMSAKFSPTLLSGVPVKVSGVIVYNFVANDRPAMGEGGKGISGGVLNGKAVSLPLPGYPPAARAVRASGAVSVQVVLSETGEVESASAVSGHPLLRAAAVEAARSAKFAPTTLSGNPVKVSGILVYNFVAPDEGNK